jgi:hypothetical protein
MTAVEDLIYSLTDGLSDKDLDTLVNTVRLKLEAGISYEQLHTDFLSAIYGTVEMSTSGISEEEIMNITEEVADKLVSRLLDKLGVDSDPVPAGLIN